MDDIDSLFTLTENLNTNSDDDADIINVNEVPVTQYYVEKEKALSLQRTYVLHLCCSQGGKDRLVLGLSNYKSLVFDLETLSQIACLSGHESTVTGLKVCAGEDDVVYTSSLDGTIKLWDLRLKKNMVKEFKVSSNSAEFKPITSFDVSLRKTLIAAGTELVDGDAYMLFWDARSTNLLGGYWESHRDDITHVQFHPSKKDWLASGSTDGLMNVFDLCEATEDDALLSSMNTETSVDKLHWFVCPNKVDGLACTTHTQDLQLWDTDSGVPYMEHTHRDMITKVMQRTNAEHCYLIDFVSTGNEEEVSLLAGSTTGKGECLKMLKMQEKTLTSVAAFNGNKQIVRSVCYDKNSDVLITGGEGGLFTVWKSDYQPKEIHIAPLKAKTKLRHSNRKPY